MGTSGFLNFGKLVIILIVPFFNFFHPCSAHLTVALVNKNVPSDVLMVKQENESIDVFVIPVIDLTGDESVSSNLVS